MIEPVIRELKILQIDDPEFAWQYGQTIKRLEDADEAKAAHEAARAALQAEWE